MQINCFSIYIKTDCTRFESSRKAIIAYAKYVSLGKQVTQKV